MLYYTPPWRALVLIKIHVYTCLSLATQPLQGVSSQKAFDKGLHNKIGAQSRSLAGYSGFSPKLRYIAGPRAFAWRYSAQRCESSVLARNYILSSYWSPMCAFYTNLECNRSKLSSCFYFLAARAVFNILSHERSYTGTWLDIYLAQGLKGVI
jgi:hypothetical protein